MSAYISHAHLHTYVCIQQVHTIQRCACVYIYIEREREKENEGVYNVYVQHACILVVHLDVFACNISHSLSVSLSLSLEVLSCFTLLRGVLPLQGPMPKEVPKHPEPHNLAWCPAIYCRS